MRILILPSLMDKSLCRQVTKKHCSTHCCPDVTLNVGKDPDAAKESAFRMGRGQENLTDIVVRGGEQVLIFKNGKHSLPHLLEASIYSGKTEGGKNRGLMDYISYIVR